MQLTGFLNNMQIWLKRRCLQLKAQLILFFMATILSNSALANPTCTVAATGANAIYDPLGAINTFGVGNILVDCLYVGLGSASPAYQIQLSAGASNTYNNRTMRYLANSLVYNLYTNASHSLVWGNGTGGTSVVADSYTMSAGTVARNYPVYMRIPGAQAINAGTYSDSITITVIY